MRPGVKTEEWFEQLLQECEKFAVEQKLSRLICGMSAEHDTPKRRQRSLSRISENDCSWF